MALYPFFSVVVPVYNKEPYIERALKSILNQEFDNFEVIVVCDPSSDKSNEEVEKIYDSRVKVYYRDTPGPGGYAARNLGVSKSKSDWIAFLDADDEWLPDHLLKVKEGIENNPECKLFTCERVSKSGLIITKDKFSRSQNGKNRFISFDSYLKFCIKGRRPNNTNSITINKSLMPNCFWFPDGRASRSGDLYLWVVLMAKAKTMIWLPHTGSISYRDVVGVSRTNTPSLTINHQMVDELESFLTSDQSKLLKKYANRLIRTAWFEKKKINPKLNFPVTI